MQRFQIWKEIFGIAVYHAISLQLLFLLIPKHSEHQPCRIFILLFMSFAS